LRPLVVVALLAAGCYNPDPADGAFTCIIDTNYICPDGLSCDIQRGICVHRGENDLASVDLSTPFDMEYVAMPRSCDDRVTHGGFANLTNLGAVNSADNESSLTLSSDGSRIYFLSGSPATLYTATVNGKSAGARAAVTLAGAPGPLNGGSLTSDGKYWFSSTVGAATALYSATPSSPTSFTVGAASEPTAACPFYDPVFLDGDVTKSLFLSYPIRGCGGDSYVAVDKLGQHINLFWGVTSIAGVASPSLLPGGLTLLFSTTTTPRGLYFAARNTVDNDEFNTSGALFLGPLGLPSGSGDWQAVVAPDCNTLYLVAERPGGHGGTDLWAADILK
jgi:hypothetical protein